MADLNSSGAALASPLKPDGRSWWSLMNRYHWFVFIVAALGWMFDCLDQQLFNLARVPAMKDLLSPGPGQPAAPGDVAKYGGYATSVFLIGWATGGLVFGVLGDKIGRAKTMMLTILMYSAFTGLSALSVGVWDFAFYRFLTGLGVGGEFAVGVALVAEVLPDRARPYALGLLQALSAIGNVTAAVIAMVLGTAAEHGTGGIDAGNYWRIMFLIGIVPALLVVVVRRRLKEPERWRAAVVEGGAQFSVPGSAPAGPSASAQPVLGYAPRRKRAGSYVELFSDPRWRRNALVGMVLAFTGVVGLWGIGFFSVDLTQTVFRKHFVDQGVPADQIGGKLTYWAGITSVMINVGAFCGMNAFSWITGHIGRRPTFAIFFVLAGLSTAMVFLLLDQFHEIFWMVPIMGFCQLALFGGYAIYFPELFPTHLRSTGTSFCYNVGRFVAASGPATLGLLTAGVFAHHAEPMRYAGLTMCSIFVLGLIILPFAPETRGKPLPEDEEDLAAGAQASAGAAPVAAGVYH